MGLRVGWLVWKSYLKTCQSSLTILNDISKNIPRADLILPEMEIESDGLVEKVKVTRTAPCGSTNYIAEHRHSNNL